MAARSKSPNQISKRMYLVPILSNALDILELLQQSRESYSLEEIHHKTGVAKSTAFRLLRTFIHRGYMTKNENGKYRSVARPGKLRFGYASMCEQLPFPATVTEGLKRAAKSAGIELLVLDNNMDPAKAIANAEEFIAQSVDLVLEYQADESSAAYIAHRFFEAGIPLVSIDIPHPRSIFFGVDNYQTGYAAGELLAAHAREHWRGKADIFLGLGMDQAGPLVGNRISAALRAVRDQLGEGVKEMKVILRDTGGGDEKSRLTTAHVLEQHPDAKRILVVTTSDSSALGAVAAVRQLKRTRHVAIASQDCLPEAVQEMQRANSPLIGSVSHEAHAYGERLIHICLSLLKNEAVDPYYFVEHRPVTRAMAQQLAER